MTSKDAPNILISKVFNGTYLDESQNIGHEIINFFKDDKGCMYFYIPGNGKVKKPFQERGTLVFLVGAGNRNVKSNDVIVYAVAEVEEYLGDKPAPSDVSYGGLPVAGIFSNNSYRGEAEAEAEARLTYRLKCIKEPKNELRLHYTGINESYTDQKGWLHHDEHYKSLFQRQRTCLKQGKATDVSRDLAELYNDDNLWKPWEPWDLSRDESSLWSLLRRDTDELSYSNVLAYLMRTDPYLAKHITCSMLDLESDKKSYMASEGELKIKREWKNMDIVITYDHPEFPKRFVIENKINAGIVIERDGRETQLDKYVRICESLADRTNYYCLLMPNYRSISDDEKSKKGQHAECSGRKFETKKYSELKSILERYHKEETWEAACKQTAEYRLIYDEFLSQIGTLSSERNNSYKRIMFRRFKEMQDAC